jgi:phosphotransferase system HPr-like phosphotransfer protein
MLYNTINNHEESERLTNYQGEPLNRKSILELINTYLKKTETLTALGKNTTLD